MLHYIISTNRSSSPPPLSQTTGSWDVRILLYIYHHKKNAHAPTAVEGAADIDVFDVEPPPFGFPLAMNE